MNPVTMKSQAVNPEAFTGSIKIKPLLGFMAWIILAGCVSSNAAHFSTTQKSMSCLVLDSLAGMSIFSEQFRNLIHAGAIDDRKEMVFASYVSFNRDHSQSIRAFQWEGGFLGDYIIVSADSDLPGCEVSLKKLPQTFKTNLGIGLGMKKDVFVSLMGTNMISGMRRLMLEDQEYFFQDCGSENIYGGPGYTCFFRFSAGALRAFGFGRGTYGFMPVFYDLNTMKQ